MKKFSLLITTLFVSALTSLAQTTQYPIDTYDEPRVDETIPTGEWKALPEGLQATWASRDELYQLRHVPQVKQTDATTVYAWRGERVNLEAVLYSKADEGEISVRFTGGDAAAWSTARYLRYVITDDYKACGNHNFNLMPWLVPDVVDQDKALDIKAMETRPVWCTIEVPRTAEAGEHTTALEVVNSQGKVVKTLALTIHVDSHTLPLAKDQQFHLDLWQQPYAVSRYYGVERWSEAHIQALRPYLEALGKAGQKVVSTIMFYEPWGYQSHDKFSPMVQTTKKADGTWDYDYSIFDLYVNLCAEYGITEQINCYSMVPWDMTFRYYDEAQGKDVDLKTTTSSAEYAEVWNAFLDAFKVHLQEKGWFEKTCIAMDERGEQAMLDAYAIASAKGFKMALAGNYHASLNDKLHDLSLAPSQFSLFSDAQIKTRKESGSKTTFYVSCADVEPNIYSNSLPAEAAYLPIYAAAAGLDGFLHWSWINWDEHPLTDSRFRLFGSGDTYFYYPGNRSSVRFERLVEGIQQYEKIQILREELKGDAAKTAVLNQLLEDCKQYSVAGTECAKKVDRLEAFLNGREVEMPKPEDITTGYYRIASKATARYEHLYNDAMWAQNSYRYTLQSNSQVMTNNGVWRVDVDDKTLTLKNGDGQPMVAGKGGNGGVMATLGTLHVTATHDAGGYRYYQFEEAPNCSNNGFKLGNVPYLTTWTAGGAADDNLWRFERVDTEDKHIYNVVVDGNANAYVTLTDGTIREHAFDGGFFIADRAISVADLEGGIVGNILKGCTITLDGNTITMSRIDAFEEPARQTLFSTLAGGMNIPPYRIPGITCGKDGRLVAAAARLVCGTDPGYGQVDCVVKISDDNGLTWSPQEIDAAVGNGKTSATVNYFECAYGDPAVVADRESDEVLIMAVAGCTVYGNGNTNRQNPNLIAAIHSLDGGQTWQTPVDLTEDIYGLFDSGNPMAAAFVGGGKVFQSRLVKVGQYYRLYAALAARPNGNRVIYSDDFGRTWKALGGASALPVPGGDEPKCEELPDGRVIITSRTGGGRLMNIYTYTDTPLGEGSWQTETKATFAGLSASPSSNPTNGELLIVPVKRNEDGHMMYVALQSVPTGSGRNNVGIFYKELADIADIRDINAFTTSWDGFYQVSKTASAYSSLDLQADDRIAFFYEETLTKWGTKANPVSTSFPTGSGQHNFDGFENIYLPIPLELITGGRYTVARDINRGAYLQNYFTALIDDADLDDVKAAELRQMVANLGAEPTYTQIDAIYAELQGGQPKDPFDGRNVTLTNVQQNGTEYTLYIDNTTLSISTQTADELGEAAIFRCEKQANGKYTLYNEAKERYMIWRAGNNYGYNNNLGTIENYNATYCDWSFNSAHSTKEDTYYLVSKRSNGTTDGALIIMATGVFDSWGNSVGWSSTYSNLFRIDVKEMATAIDAPIATDSRVRKVKQGNRIVIFRDGEHYNIAGQRIK